MATGVIVAIVTLVLMTGALALVSPTSSTRASWAGGAGTPPSGPQAPVGGATIPISGVLTAVPDLEPGAGISGAALVGTPVTGPLHILVTLPYAHPEELSSFLEALSNPSSPEYHDYVDQAQFDALYGQPASVYDAVLAYFAGYGVSDLTSYADHTSLSFVGSPAQVAAAFHTGLANYDAAGLQYYGPTAPLAVPASLAPYVAGVEGLSDYANYLTSTSIVGETVVGSGQVAPSVQLQPAQGTGPCSAFTCTTVDNLSYPEPVSNFPAGDWHAEMLPAPDLQVAYNVTPVYQEEGYQSAGTHSNTIATLLFTGPVDNETALGSFCANQSSADWAWDFYAPDVSNYFTYTLPVGEPHSQVTSVPITGYTYDYPSGSQGLSASCQAPGGPNLENTLDVEMAGSMAPGASIYQLFGGDSSVQSTVDTEFVDVLNPSTGDFSTTGGSDTAATVAGLRNVTVVSNSWTNDATDISCVEKANSSWNLDLEQAQARGITVLAGSGDFALGQPCTPAAQAYDTYGDVAVGGTTITLNTTSLARTSESVWDVLPCEIDPHVCEGSGGGVSTTFAEPSWQASSADANAVITAVASGRGAPDIAAAANDTMIDVTSGGTTYNVTGYPSGTGVFLMGTSFATPLEAGIVDQLNFALGKSGDGRLGFLDPQAYAWGQDQYTGSLADRPFFDVTQGKAAYSAEPGYDLATGWGPINASGWMGLVPSLGSVTFTATGLPAGKTWGATLSGLTQSTTAASIVFHEPLSTDNYTVAPPAGYYASPLKGQVTVAGSPVNVSVEILLNSTVTFRESGLPSGQAWNVSFASGPYQESKTTTDVFHVQNLTGEYPYAVADSWDGTHIYYTPSPASGDINVTSGSEEVNVTYTEHTLCPRCELPGTGSLGSVPSAAQAAASAGRSTAGAVGPLAALTVVTRLADPAMAGRR